MSPPLLLFLPRAATAHPGVLALGQAVQIVELDTADTDDFPLATEWARAELRPRLEGARREGARIALWFADARPTTLLALQRAFDWDEFVVPAADGPQRIDAATGAVQWVSLDPVVPAAPTPKPPPTPSEPPPPPVAAPASPEPPPPTRGALLHEVRKFAAWNDAAALEAATATFLRHYPNERAALDWEVARGRDAGEALAELERVVRRGDVAEIAKFAAQVERDFPWVKGSVKKKVAWGEAKRRQREEDRARRAEGRPLSTVEARGEHRIPLLAPASAWTLFLDETGARFDGVEEGEGGLQGRLVGLLVPEGAGLPPLAKDFHATSASAEQCDAAVQAVLDGPTGILGIGVDDLPPTPGERWADGVMEVVHWVTRLLPLPAEGPVEVRVVVEARGPYTAAGDWSVPAREVQRQLADRDPARAARLRLHIQVAPKGAEVGLAYVDAIAHAWGSPSKAAKARLAQSRLTPFCLVEGDGRAIRRMWDLFGPGRWPSGYAWRQLLARADARDPHGIAGILLDRLAVACRAQPTLWLRYLEASRRHLDGKAVDLRALGQETEWLAACAPERPLPGGLRLAWLTAQLARANHAGAADVPEVEGALEALADGLVEESGPLVCLADLHRAVLATNRFDFAGARAALTRWATRDPAVPGLQMWGRVQSSLGQHDAFEGDNARALERFATADAAFARLSDPALASGERRHTATYAAIATMDLPGTPREAARAAVERVIGPLAEALPRLAASDGESDKYAHHLALRYLCHLGTPEEREAYLACRKDWEDGEGHPWPLIQLYRGLLLRDTDPAGAIERLLDGYDAANTPDSGPTVRLIGAVLATIGVAWGIEWPDREATLASLEAELPHARPRIDRLRAALVDPAPALALLRAVLPFNFR